MAAADFQVGDTVVVKKHGRATIIDGPCMDPASPYYERFHVLYLEDSSKFWVTKQRLRKLNPCVKRCHVAFCTEEYRRAAVHNTCPSDVCLEIGCHAGVTTRVIYNRALRVIGVDSSKHAVDVAKQKHPHIQFAVLDGHDVEGSAALLEESPATWQVLDGHHTREASNPLKKPARLGTSLNGCNLQQQLHAHTDHSPLSKQHQHSLNSVHCDQQPCQQQQQQQQQCSNHPHQQRSQHDHHYHHQQQQQQCSNQPHQGRSPHNQQQQIHQQAREQKQLHHSQQQQQQQQQQQPDHSKRDQRQHQQRGGPYVNCFSPFTRVFVDISGQAPLTLIVPLLLRWLKALKPPPGHIGAQLVVKNRALYRYLASVQQQQSNAASSSLCCEAGGQVKGAAKALSRMDLCAGSDSDSECEGEGQGKRARATIGLNDFGGSIDDPVLMSGLAVLVEQCDLFPRCAKRPLAMR